MTSELTGTQDNVITRFKDGANVDDDRQETASVPVIDGFRVVLASIVIK